MTVIKGGTHEKDSGYCKKLLFFKLHYIMMFLCVCAAVSYIPKKVVARAGQNVTVYCVFNDHSINASTAMWILNFKQPLHRSQYHPVNQWVRNKNLSPSKALCVSGNISNTF